MLRRPGLETKIARSEVKLLIVRWIVRDMHLAILPKILAVRVDDRRGVVINSRRAFLEERGDNDDAAIPGDVLQFPRRGPGNFLGESKVRVVFGLAKVLRAKE